MSNIQDKFGNRRQFPREDMAERGVAFFDDGTRVACIIHDMSEATGKYQLGMRVELLNVPGGKVPHSFVVQMKSGRTIRYTPEWKSNL